MKILLAPDSFKESLSAPAVAAALAEGLARVLPGASLDLVPLADGGEGTLAALLAAAGGQARGVLVTGPLGAPVSATLGLLEEGPTAIVETAQAAGLALVPPEARNPLDTTTYGVGQLISAALDLGVCRFIVGLGGSATVDGGAGLLQALGARLLDARGRALSAPARGRDLARVAAVDLAGFDGRILDAEFRVACDVDNPLCGTRGAAAVFGPQKGATPAQVVELDDGLTRFHEALRRTTGREVAGLAGAGAAGGLGAAFLACFPGSFEPGIELVMAAVQLERRLAGATLVVTGEGRLDAQTLHGKAPAGVARLARAHGIPVVAVGGALLDVETLLEAGLFDALEACVTRPLSLTEALDEAHVALVATGIRIGLWLRLQLTPQTPL